MGFNIGSKEGNEKEGGESRQEGYVANPGKVA